MIPKAVKNWIKESKKLFSLYLISNNPSKKRIAKIAKELNYEIMKLSGTEFRKKLRNGEAIPEWFAFKSVVDVLRRS